MFQCVCSFLANWKDQAAQLLFAWLLRGISFSPLFQYAALLVGFIEVLRYGHLYSDTARERATMRCRRHHARLLAGLAWHNPAIRSRRQVPPRQAVHRCEEPQKTPLSFRPDLPGRYLPDR